MVPNQECRHVPAKKGADFLTQLYPEMGGQVNLRTMMITIIMVMVRLWWTSPWTRMGCGQSWP